MNCNLQIIVRVIVDTAFFMTFSNEEVLEDDVAVAFMEGVSATLQEMTTAEKTEFLSIVHHLASSYAESIRQQFVEDLG